MKADFTIPTAAEELGIEELDEHDKVVGEEGTAAKAKAKQSHHQRGCSLTFFRSNNLRVNVEICTQGTTILPGAPTSYRWTQHSRLRYCKTT